MEIKETNQGVESKLLDLLKTVSDNQYVQCPCKVLAVNGNYVDVLPIINDDMENVPIYDVKVHRKESSTAYIFLGIHVGDRGVLRFFDRSIENYSINGSEVYNEDDRIHDANDGCFELGFLPDNEAYVYPTVPQSKTVDELIPTFKSEKFNTSLTNEEEEAYQLWFNGMKQQGYIVDGDIGYDYDFRGAFKAGFSPSEVGGHWVDTWKKPNHQTFSNESIYATGEYAQYAGTWSGDTFNMPESRIMPVQEIEIGLKNVKFKLSVDNNGNVDILSEGNVNLKVTGNVTSQIDGNMTSTIKGNVEATVEGDVTSTIKGDVTSTINGNMTSTIKGNEISTILGNSTTTVTGTANLTAPTINTTGVLNQVGAVNIAGLVTVTGAITATKEITGNGILLSKHTHIGNLGEPTSEPQ